MSTSKKKWLKITIKADPVLVESISDFLMGIIGAGVETGALDEDSYGTVNGYVEQADQNQAEIDDILGKVSSYLVELAILFAVSEPDFSSTIIVEEDWGKSWKEHFKPFTIVPGLVISPIWEEYKPLPGELLIEMDPGMAFGTGHHATTSLSLGFIKEALALSDSSQRLLDVGTGTGILGMAAVLFGAGEILGIDNDPDAVAAAKENVVRNQLHETMQVTLAPISTLEESFQIVVANIIHDVLVEMLADLTRLTAGNGVLILSGILVGEQVENVVTLFTEAGMSLRKKEVSEEWAALMFVKGT
jgi:ribosomal protein L11 methyltransferase